MEVLSARLVMMIEPEALQRIDEYRWDQRMQSRSEAVRRLVEIGLTSKSNGPAEAATSPGLNHANPATGESDEQS